MMDADACLADFGAPSLRLRKSLQRVLNALLTLVVAGSAAACLTRVPLPSPRGPLRHAASLTLYRRPLEILFSEPRQQAPEQVFILYATGDGGWKSQDRQTFQRLTEWGYPVAGFSARRYLKNLGYVSDTTTPRRLARDYARILDFVRASLHLPPAARAILVGVSRGAGLSVVAAGQRDFQPQLAGVLAIALTKEEEYVLHYRLHRGGGPRSGRRRERVKVETYQYLPQLSGLPVAVIQSTHDHYLPAAAARQLFGPDTATRQFHAIPASNHSFGGAREALYSQMHACLAWICSLPSLGSGMDQP